MRAPLAVAPIAAFSFAVWVMLNGFLVEPLYGFLRGGPALQLITLYVGIGILVGFLVSLIAFRITYSLSAVLLGTLLGGALPLLVLPLIGFLFTDDLDVPGSLIRLSSSLFLPALIGKLLVAPLKRSVIKYRPQPTQVRGESSKPHERVEVQQGGDSQINQGATAESSKQAQPLESQRTGESTVSTYVPPQSITRPFLQSLREELMRGEQQLRQAITPLATEARPPERRGDEKELSPLETRLAEYITAEDLKEIVPSLDRSSTEGGRYRDVEEALGIDTSTVTELLRQLALKNYLRINGLAFKVIICPKCKSAMSVADFVCSSCRSPNIARQRILQHLLCGYMGPENMFVKDDMLVCPRCGESVPLGLEASVPSSHKTSQMGIRTYSSFFRCYDCGEINVSPHPTLTCLTCGNNYDLRSFEARYFYRYIPNQERLSQLAASQRPIKLLSERLRELGYEVEVPAKLVGTSKVIHRLEMVILNKQRPVAGIAVLSAQEHLSISEIMRMAILKLDVRIPKLIAMVTSPLSEEATKLANFQSIELIELYKVKDFEREVVEPIIQIIRREVGG